MLDGKAAETVGVGGAPLPEADPEVDCGGGANDRAVLDLLDDPTPIGCEIVERSDAFEHHHPRLGGTSALLLAADDTVGVRLRCPRAQHRACSGRLTLALARNGARKPAETRYRVAAGGDRMLRVRLSDAEALRVRRAHGSLAGVVIAHELSAKGKPKTTSHAMSVRSAS